MIPWDAVVIGAGPAGSSASISLARQGRRVLLLEKTHYPHDKVCGEFLSPECLPLLYELLGEINPALTSAVPIRTVRLTAPSGRTWSARFQSSSLGISRWALDTALFQQAREVGVCTLQGAEAIDIRGNFHQGYEIDFRENGSLNTVQARVVVGAHGKRSRIDSVLKRPFMQHDQDFMAFKAHFSGSPFDDRIELFTFPGGYCGLSDIEGHLQNVCFLIRRTVFQEVVRGTKDPISHLVTWIGSQNSQLGRCLTSLGQVQLDWITIAQVPFESKGNDRQGILYVGDAARVMAPLAGNGITVAIESGILVANLLAGYFKGKKSLEEVGCEYQHAWNHRYRARMELGNILQKLILNPSVASLAILLISRIPGLGDTLLAKTRGRINP
jgi:flavin-dependent dehydrogenase